MVHRNRLGVLGVLGLALFLVGCGKTVTINHSDGTSTEIPEKVYMAQQQQAAALDLASKFSEAFQPPDAELSAQGEMMHGFQNILAMVMMPQIAEAMQQDGYWRYESAKLNFWGNVIAGPATALLQPFANRLAYGEGGMVSGGGTYIKQNNRVTGTTLSNSGNLAGGAGGPGGPGSAGEEGMVPGGEGAPGGVATGGSRSISIGGIGNMSNSQDAYNGFQNRWNEILHGTGTIGKQPQAGFGDEHQFAPINDRDEGSAQLF